MRDDPLTVISFAQAHGEAKLQWLSLPALVDVYAMPDRGHKRNVTSRSDLNIGEIKHHRLLSRVKERLPCRHVVIDTA